MIETERLILRPFTEKDSADLFEYLSKPTVHCFACMKVNSIAEAKVAALERAKNVEYYFAITLKDTGKVIGEINAMPESSAPDEKHAVQDTFSPCWMLNTEYHGKGYAYEAARAFFEYLFLEMGARRIYAYTEDYNLSSQKLCEKLGMRREGLYKEFVTFINDEDGNPIYENTYQYAILKKEWMLDQSDCMSKQIAALATDEENMVIWDIDALLSDYKDHPYTTVDTKLLIPREWLTIDAQYSSTTNVNLPIILFELPNDQVFIADGNHRLYRAVIENIPTMNVILIPQEKHLTYLFRCTVDTYYRVIDELKDEGIFIYNFTKEGLYE